MPSCQERPSESLEVQVDLRAVERAVALVDRVGEPVRVQRLLERALGVVPQRVVADALVRARRELEPILSKPKTRVGREREVQAAATSSWICSSVQKTWASSWAKWRTRSRPCSAPDELVAVQQPGLGVAHRQVAVGPLLQPEQVAVAGAVHRLERHRAVLGLGDEHVLAVLAPVPGGLPQLGVVELRGLDLGVAALARPSRG